MRVDPMMQLNEAITSVLEAIVYPSMVMLAVMLLGRRRSRAPFEDPPAGTQEQGGRPHYRARPRQSWAQRPRGTSGALGNATPVTHRPPASRRGRADAWPS